jgi:hypothetical protein
MLQKPHPFEKSIPLLANKCQSSSSIVVLFVVIIIIIMDDIARVRHEFKRMASFMSGGHGDLITVHKRILERYPNFMKQDAFCRFIRGGFDSIRDYNLRAIQDYIKDVSMANWPLVVPPQAHYHAHHHYQAPAVVTSSSAQMTWADIPMSEY